MRAAPKIWISGRGITASALSPADAHGAAFRRIGGGVQRRHRHCDQRVAAEPALLRRAVEVDQQPVDR
jgi:hypothetical protein